MDNDDYNDYRIKAQKERDDADLKDWTIPELSPRSRMCELDNHRPCTGTIRELRERACGCWCHDEAVAA
ncbi:hypothetical protein [Gulosibacter molinativorax]|uniref:Uncharacterized protein n=1 Tax=Gulosibacter molinativorax TaxID=256821 RepID=A0ABT7C643_9MICO|nr:hypothetical protein [Gulosibacter molinativorax]MDJ1370652.1 hypothetical protein [Gulosibacter molinativorax]QUY63323.1 Hypotetical protein [Gulosibacter molinativorax]